MADITPETVAIDRDTYLTFLSNQAWIDALCEAGVGNWEGIDFANELYREYRAEED